MVFLLINIINYTPVLALHTDKGIKTVYLIFEDGPSVNITNKIINTLNENDVKATFFVIGDTANIYPYMIKTLKESNMCIMPHCNVHDYSYLYKSEENYFKDLDKCKETIKSITGEGKLNFIKLLEYPNNSQDKRQILSKIQKKIISNGEYYIGHTIAIGDERSKDISSEFINSKLRDEGGLNRVEVVLMHDCSNQTIIAEALQDVIKYYKEKGYIFKTLNEMDSWEIDYLKKNKVLNKE